MKQSSRKAALIFSMVLILGVFQSACDQDGGDGEDNSTVTTTTLGGGGINPASCIPCGDLNLDCQMNCEITGCPICMDMDENGGMKMMYDDGSYSLMTAGGSMTFYDSTDKQCFRMEISGNKSTYYTGDDEECYSIVPGPGDDEISFIVEGREYVYHEDKTWDCPDGSTWELPSSCDQANDGQEDMHDTSNCPPVTGICE